MRKISSLFMLLMLYVGMAWGQKPYVGITELPTKAKDPNALTSGYYMLKEVNKQANEDHGWLKAASEAVGAEVDPQGEQQPVLNNCATYLWYIEVTGTGKDKTFTIGTVNKKAAWQAPELKQKNLVAYDNAGRLKLTTETVNLGSHTATPQPNSAIITNENSTACVHYSGHKLGSWTDANPASVMMFEFYEVPKNHLSTVPVEVAALPEPGKRYFIYNDHQKGHIYYNDNGSGIGFNNNAKTNSKDFVWVCQKTTDGKFTFQNLATNKYFGWKELSPSAYGWTVSATDQVSHPDRGNVTLYGTNRYLVGAENRFDQATTKFDNATYSSDFHFELCTLSDDQFVNISAEDFISNAYGEKWVRISWNKDINSTAGYEEGTSAFENKIPKGFSTDLTSAEQLWTLVGNNKEGFLMQHKVAGANLALKVDAAANGNAAKMVAKAQATKWKLVQRASGVFSIVHATNTNQGLNSWAGAYGELKMYGANDPGSQWQLQTVVPAFSVASHLAGSVEAQYLLGSAKLNFTVDGRTISSNVGNSADFKVCYLPNGASVKVEPAVSRGYKLDQLMVNGENKPFAEFTITSNMTDKVEAFFTSSYEAGLYLYKTPDAKGNPYRIPAIMTAPNGHIFAISDNRPAKADIGYGEVDIKCRISKDNGRTWGEEFFIANGHGKANATNNGPWDYGFGDAAVVADCERNEVLIMMVCGKTVCHDGQYDPNDPYNPAKSPNRVARVRGKYNEATGKWEFTDPEEVTFDIYPLFDKVNANGSKERTVRSLFIGSGRICQSRMTKVGEYYRIYCALWTKNEGNRVIYSDDFGKSWHVLGTVDERPARNGDEPKCEELPNGDVILSSRNSGRIFNIFRFTNREKGEGKWSTEQGSNACPNGINVGNNTNGEIMLFKAVRKLNGEKVVLAVQSVPFASDRSNVGVYYKEITAALYDGSVSHDKSVRDLASNWTKGLQVSHVGSAYSTMTLQKDNKIGFFFEEAPGGYCMVYIPLTLEQMTEGNYTLDTAAYGDFLTTHEAQNLNCALASYSSTVATTPNIAGVKAFYVTEAIGDMVKMTEIAAGANGKVVVPANTGVLLQTANAQKFSMMPSEVAGTAVANNKLVATGDKTVIVEPTVNAYILSGDVDGAAFFKLSAAERTIAANRAYLVLPKNLNAEKMRISFGDLTGIEGVETDEVNAPIYDLSGRRVVKVVKGGVYIQNGRKFIVK